MFLSWFALILCQPGRQVSVVSLKGSHRANNKKRLTWNGRCMQIYMCRPSRLCVTVCVCVSRRCVVQWLKGSQRADDTQVCVGFNVGSDWESWKYTVWFVSYVSGEVDLLLFLFSLDDDATSHRPPSSSLTAFLCKPRLAYKLKTLQVTIKQITYLCSC